MVTTGAGARGKATSGSVVRAVGAVRLMAHAVVV